MSDEVAIKLDLDELRDVESQRPTTSNQSDEALDASLSMKVEVFGEAPAPPPAPPPPPRPRLKDYEASESEDVVRNADVLRRLGAFTKSSVSRWLCQHPSCPPVFAEKGLTAEGRKQIKVILLNSFAKLRKLHRDLSKSNAAADFVLQRYEFPPWRDAAVLPQKPSTVRRKKEEAYLSQLRASLAEKQEELRRLKAVFEPPPSKEDGETLRALERRRVVLEERRKKWETETKELTATSSLNEEELSRLSKKKKSMRERVNYYAKCYDKLESKVSQDLSLKTVQRNRKNLAERLNHQRNQVFVLDEERKVLVNENTALKMVTDDATELVYRAKPPVSGKCWNLREEESGGTYSPEMVKVINDMIDAGIDVKDVQTVFETVFQAVEHSISGFPPIEAVARFHRTHRKEAENASVSS